MPVIGFSEGKNKEDVYKTDEMDSLLSAKQDQHSKTDITLVAGNWSNKAQTVNVTGVTANNTVLIAPVPASSGLYGACGVLCTAQAEGTLTFTCDFTPSDNILVNVVILGV